eukprot:GHVU01214828.1.p1 GENE.GHVU01214828.1~~GHVU01214828.1.p1  ORF type:complete len:271 (+),score=8.45 GHVU01214828.1:47-814(+)
MDEILLLGKLVHSRRYAGEILCIIHSGHQGITKCTERVATSVWWHSINRDIAHMVQACDFCQVHKPAQRKEPLHPTPLLERPWQHVAADLLEHHKGTYIVVIDYLSRYIELAHLPSTTSAEVISKLKSVFASWGVPELLTTDNAGQFTAELFKSFAEEYNFQQVLSSPYHAQANGEAESAVKIAKRILKQDDSFSALLAYRSTTVQATGSSPTKLIMGWKIRTPLPVLSKTLEPRWPNLKMVREQEGKTSVQIPL